MEARTKRALAALAAGILFGAGLVVSGMTQPDKVLGFLDPFGAWDPSLAFVMAGAISVHLVAHRLVRGTASPLFAPRWSLPTRKDIDVRLVLGALVFGVGWGLGGYCPGPGIVSLAAGAPGVVVFVVAMASSMLATVRLEAVFESARPEGAAGRRPRAT